MSNRSLRRALPGAGALTTAAVLAFGGAATAQEPAPPSEAPPRAVLRTTVELDKPHYLLHEDMRMKFTITNIGGQVAERVRFRLPPGDPHYDRWNWAPLRETQEGIRLEPGETRVLEFSGGVVDRYNGSTAGIEDKWFDFAGRQETGEDHFTAVAPVTPTEGDIRGVVYADKNRNGRQDAGEALAGTAVGVRGGRRMRAERTTDAGGRFLFAKAPGGTWSLSYSHPDGWVVPEGDGSVQTVRVTPAGVELSVRAERPASDSVQAELALDRTVYRPGDPVTITATLTNSGARAVEGVQATCLDHGSKHHVGSGAGWGDLAPAGPGVTIAAGETRTFSVTDVVPREALARGEVLAVCRFGPHVLDGAGYAEATASAAVTGEPEETSPPTPGPVPPGPGGAAVPEPAARVALARTGAAVLGLGLLGVLLVASGAGLLRASRNREARDADHA
ncbi:SdrD B-like domain-containing protein [Lentzea sp. NPDC060358]|uniref:SdrD B-like domain-containing protein n=1 Tax=Lentzea sp. NPDC060358 TaxID=3347103 RepID=UPI003666CE8C